MRCGEPHAAFICDWPSIRCRSAIGHSYVLWVDDGLTQSELSERAGLMQPTTFFAVNGMEQLGYIRREKLPGSRCRNVHIFLTTAGRALRNKLAPYASEIDAPAVAGLSSRDIAVTRRTLLAVIQNLADDEQEGLRKKRRVRSTREISRFMRTSRSAKRRRAALPRDAGNRVTRTVRKTYRTQRSTG